MKKKIALLAGGYSGESVVSYKSARTIQENLDQEQYEVYLISVMRESWFYQTASGKKVAINKDDFSLNLEGQKITFDLAFIAIHGTPGEDGKLQGYLDLVGIPYSTCNTLVSALTFNKAFCNQVMRSLGIVKVARSVVVHKQRPYSLGSLLEHLQLPVFVKPSESGSSIGVSKVTEISEMIPALETAFKESDLVLIEEMIQGTELTMGVYQHQNTIITLPATEIVSKKEFFDFEAKYTTGVTDEITPARISDALLNEMKTTTTAIYEGLNCSGLVRVDYILETATNHLYFLEINTVPGQSENSLIPKAVKYTGKTLTEFYGQLAEECLSHKS